jgi:hypothetical protein
MPHFINLTVSGEGCLLLAFKADAMTTHSSAAVRQNASIIMKSVCDLPRGIAPFVQRLLHAPDLLVQVPGIKSVSESVSSFDDADTPAAVKALAALQRKDSFGTADRVVQTLDMLQNLVNLLCEGQVPAETQQAVAEVLRRMGETDGSYGASYLTRYSRRSWASELLGSS